MKCLRDGELPAGRRCHLALRYGFRIPLSVMGLFLLPVSERESVIREVFFMQKTHYSSNIKMLCLAGVMAALYVCLDFLAVSVSAPLGDDLKISISGLPIIVVAIFYGPWWGAATGFVGAFVGQLITYGIGATTFFWVLPAVVRGIMVGYLFRAFKKSTRPSILAIETCLSSLVVTLLNTGAMLVDQMLYDYSTYYEIFIAIPLRVIAGILTALVFTLMLPTIIDSLKQYIKI